MDCSIYLDSRATHYISLHTTSLYGFYGRYYIYIIVNML